MQTQIIWQPGTLDKIAPIQKVAANQPLQLNNDPTFTAPFGAIGHVTVNPGFTRVVSVSSGTSDLTGATITITGLDTNNNVLIDAITPGPSGGNEVYGLKYFRTVTSVTSSVAANDISIGTLIDDNEDSDNVKGISEFLTLDHNLPNYAATVDVNVVTSDFYYTILGSAEAPYFVNPSFVIPDPTNPTNIIFTAPQIGTVIPNYFIDQNAINTAELSDDTFALTSDKTTTHALNSPLRTIWVVVNGVSADDYTNSDGCAIITLIQQGSPR